MGSVRGRIGGVGPDARGTPRRPPDTPRSTRTRVRPRRDFVHVRRRRAGRRRRRTTPGSGIGYDSEVGTRIRVGIVGRRVSPLGISAAHLERAMGVRDERGRRREHAAFVPFHSESAAFDALEATRLEHQAAIRASRGGRAGRARRGRARPTEDGDGTVHARAAGQRERHAVGEDREDANARARKGGGGGAAADGAYRSGDGETPKTREGAPRNANARRGRGTPRGARARERKKPKSKDERRSGRGRIGWTRRGFDASAPRTPPSRLPI